MPVATLLECATGLTHRFGRRGFRLVWLWYDRGDPVALGYRREVDRARQRVGGEVDFHGLSWQELFAALLPECVDHGSYASYLGSRYSR
jgi:hypothetical protein